MRLQQVRCPVVMVTHHTLPPQIKADATPPSLSLVFNLKSGKGFMAKDSDGLSDPYAVIELLDDGDSPNLREAFLEDSSTVKVSNIHKGTLDPVWNQEWVFENVKPKKQNLSIAFWDSDDPEKAHTARSVRKFCAMRQFADRSSLFWPPPIFITDRLVAATLC